MRVQPIIMSAAEVADLRAGRVTSIGRRIRNPERYGCLTGDCDHDSKRECAETMRRSPIGAVGDALWVREDYCDAYGPTAYRADLPCNSGPWKAAGSMPRHRSRLTLRVQSQAAVMKNEWWWEAEVTVAHTNIDTYLQLQRELAMVSP